MFTYGIFNGCNIFNTDQESSQRFYEVQVSQNVPLMLSIQILVPLVILSISLSFLNFDISMDNSPLELTLKSYGQTIVPFYISPNSRLGPQFLDHLTDVLMAEDQKPLELQSKYQAQENGAGSRPIAPCSEAMCFQAT